MLRLANPANTHEGAPVGMFVLEIRSGEHVYDGCVLDDGKNERLDVGSLESSFSVNTYCRY